MALFSSPEIIQQHIGAAKGVGAVIQGYTKAFPRPPSVTTTTHPEQGTETLTNNAKALVIVPNLV